MSRRKYEISIKILDRVFKSMYDKGLSQSEVAKKMGVPSSELTDIKKRRQRMTYQFIECLRLHYGISIDEIIDGCKKSDEEVNFTDLKEFIDRKCR